MGVMSRADEHLRYALGPLILGLLEDPTVTDIHCNPPEHLGADGTLWCERFGRPAEIVGQIDSGAAWNVVTSVAGCLGRHINATTPFIEGELFGDGPRFDGIIPPHVLAPAFSIRVPASQVFTLDQYVAAGLMSGRQSDRLEFAIRTRQNIVVVGSTGSGKTTLLNALIEAMARLTPDDRTAIIEDTFELQAAMPNKLRIRTGEALSHQQAIRRVLRYTPRRIVVGEVRGGEAWQMLKLWNTGHPGGVTSFHSDIARPHDALRRVEQMIAEVIEVPQPAVIADTIHLIVCLERDSTGRRRVAQIASVQGWDSTRREYSISPEV